MNILKKLPQQHFCQYHRSKSLSIMALLCLGVSLCSCDNADTTNITAKAKQTEQTDTNMTSSDQPADSGENGTVNDDDSAKHSNASLHNDTTTASTNMDAAQTPNKPKIIDWTKVASGVEPVDPTSYPYTFSKTSSPVKSYADYFGVDATTAQYNLTIGMASNEPLSKLLDQLGGAYQTHQLIDGEKMTLVVYTTDAIAPSSYDYVIADKIGRGLVLPIRIINKEIVVETVD